jgi:uncharacterized protein with ATP-grasp and redox domains
MTLTDKPRLPIPDPLRGIDRPEKTFAGAEKGTFTHKSIVDRLPEIARRMLAENDFSPAVTGQIETLIQEIPEGRIRPLTDTAAADAADWTGYVAPYLGQNWLQVPWFFVETYFYRRVLDATGYFRPGPGYGVDPFACQKRQGLETTWEAIRELSDQVGNFFTGDGRRSEGLGRLLAVDLWGNQADLSMWPAGHSQKPGHQGTDQQVEHTLVDDTAGVVEHLIGRESQVGRVDFILDNAGFELVADLFLAAFMLGQDVATNVFMHAKVHPTFVSDAMILDVQQTVAHLAATEHSGVAWLGEQLQTYLENGRLRLTQHDFWTSSLAMWEMPLSLKGELGHSDLLISKGDANYRRLLGDRHWPFTTPLADIVCYLPAPLVALRTLKSEVVTGLKPGQPQLTAAKDPHWLVNGRWGLIQFSNNQPS